MSALELNAPAPPAPLPACSAAWWRAVRWRAHAKAVQGFVVTHFLPLIFFVAILWAMLWPAPGKAVVKVTVLDGVHLVQEINIIIVFFISGLVLKTEDIRTALKHKVGVTYGFVAIIGITPCLGFALRAIPLTPPEYAYGLALFSAVPTTLGIGVSLVRSCKGNEGLALLLTVGTNILGVFFIPLWLKALLGSVQTISLNVDIVNLFVKLLFTIFVPSLIGKVVREVFKAVPPFTTRWKTALSLFSTFNLAMIVWQTLSGAQHIITNTPFVYTLYAILLAIAQHLLYLAFNFTIILFILRMPLLEAIATGVMSSQKSAPVAVTVISYVTKDVAQQGLFAIPAIVGQISQIFIGSALAPFMARAVVRYKAKQAALPQLSAGGVPGADEASKLAMTDSSVSVKDTPAAVAAAAVADSPAN